MNNNKNSNSKNNTNSTNSTNNNRASSISKLISKKNTSSNSSSGSSLVDSIISKVKDDEKNNLMVYIIIAIPLLLFLGYLVYKYNYSSRTSNVVSLMNYQSVVELNPLEQCYEIDATQHYKLCDYYISSSFMTPCVGNQHYDYVSNIMISEVLKSGARYIQIPICESDVTLKALPVVGTAVYGQSLVTSLNTLEIQSVLNTIVTNAFSINNNKINYPLIIHFILNTTNKSTINILAHHVSTILGNLIVNVNQYKNINNNIPIHLEKLCNLLGKIIIYSTPEYINTDLEPFVIPTKNLYQIYHFSDLGPINMPNSSIYTNTYNQKLSGTEQRNSNIYFKKEYPTIDYVLENIDSIGESILNDPNLLNNLTSFNKLGTTIVKPNYPEDVISKNYDPSESIFYGCQLTTMNFQINDLNMKNYINIFKESSFRLKPSSLRFSEAEVPTTDFSKIYTPLTKVNTNILSDFFYKYGNILIALESYTLLNTYLTNYDALSLNFSTGTVISKVNGKKKYKVGLKQLFIPRLSRMGSLNNMSMYLESASQPGHFITLRPSSTSTFDLSTLGTTNQALINQAMYIEKPKLIDNSYIADMISLRTTNDTTPLYLAAENKKIKAYIDANEMEAKSNMTFIVKKYTFRHVIQIMSSTGRSIITNSINKTLSVSAVGSTTGNTYYVNEQNKTNGQNFNIFNDQFTLENTITKKFVTYDTTDFLLYDKMLAPNQTSIYNLEAKDNYYRIMDVNNNNLILNSRDILTFKEDTNADSTSNLFSIIITYVLDVLE
jgi:hypothetical protein